MAIGDQVRGQRYQDAIGLLRLGMRLHVGIDEEGSIGLSAFTAPSEL